jgi:hypothetical protein
MPSLTEGTSDERQQSRNNRRQRLGVAAAKSHREAGEMEVSLTFSRRGQMLRPKAYRIRAASVGIFATLAAVRGHAQFEFSQQQVMGCKSGAGRSTRSICRRADHRASEQNLSSARTQDILPRHDGTRDGLFDDHVCPRRTVSPHLLARMGGDVLVGLG